MMGVVVVGETSSDNSVAVPMVESASSPSASSVAVSSHRPSLSKQTTMMTLAVPTMSDDGGGGSLSSDVAASNAPATTTVPTNLHVRRCSARLLSLNVREALKTLRQKEHKARVTAVVQRNANFYRRQRCCECVTMMSLLTLFSAVSLYVMFAYGFYVGKRQPFNLVQDGFQSKVRDQEGSSVELWCQADAYWEFCRFVHYDRFCDFEWIGSPSSNEEHEVTADSGGDDDVGEGGSGERVEEVEEMEVEGQGVTRISCDFPPGKVEMIGDYSKFQCAIRINALDKKDQGLWMCEVEKYYPGFSRRYGELRTATFTIVVNSRNSSSGGGVAPTDASSYLPDQSESVTSTNAGNATSTTLMTFSVITADDQEEEYQRQFFLLKVFILGGIGFVLTTLAILFWTYFMYLWRSWDTNKRGGVQEEEAFAAVVDGAEFFDHSSREALLDSRRKSVSFAVCTPVKEEVGEDGESKLSFDITVRSVAINRNSSSNNNDCGSGGGAGSRSSSINTVGEVIQVTVSPPTAFSDPRRDSFTTAAGSASDPVPVRRLSLAPQDALTRSPSNGSPRRGSLRMEGRRSKETPIW